VSGWVVAEPLGGWIIPAVGAVWGIQAALAAALFLAAQLASTHVDAIWYTVIISHLTFFTLLVISCSRLWWQTRERRRILMWVVFVGFITLLSAIPSVVLVDSERYPRAGYHQALVSVVVASVAGIMRFTLSYYRRGNHSRQEEVHARAVSEGSISGS
jgi:ABC-type enterochelin transport system permease subunit